MNIKIWSTIITVLWMFANANAFGASISYKEFSRGTNLPVGMAFLPNSKAALVIGQRGGLWTVEEGKQAIAIGSIKDRVSQRGYETGLLGIALHPDFTVNKKIYLNYTTGYLRIKTRISEFQMKNGKLDVGSEKIILEFSQPYPNHKGGDIHFGSDGYLYIAVGDGGLLGDPHNNAQRLDTLLGKILRIDVDGGTPYAIPADNPFVNDQNARGEIFAYGFRNPWRFSFDRQTGDLWTGDVGQRGVEEIDIIKSGGNYGWRIMEGSSCFLVMSCNTFGLTYPVWEYPRTEGISVIGGYVYTGISLSQIRGQYIYGDFYSGKIWALTPGSEPINNLLLDTEIYISSFAEDQAGELYFLDHIGGKVFKIGIYP
ncbi:MAG: sorbosone dehydrogenase family protein [Oligoflexales bacterium]